MFKVGIIGPESTGKSTLAYYLSRRFNGIFVPEYARTYMEKRALARAYTREDVLRIAKYQVDEMRLLHNLANDGRIVFFDTELIITKVWMLYKYGDCPGFIDEAIKAFPMDVYLLCYPDLPWQPDPVRENPTIREYLYDWYKDEIENLGIPYYVIRHDL